MLANWDALEKDMVWTIPRARAHSPIRYNSLTIDGYSSNDKIYQLQVCGTLIKVSYTRVKLLYEQLHFYLPRITISSCSVDIVVLQFTEFMHYIRVKARLELCLRFKMLQINVS